MTNPPRIRLVESAQARERLDAALAFLRAVPRGEEVLVVGASREAVDDLVRDHSAVAGATFGIHRYGFWQLVAHVASAELAAEHLAPATALGAEAVAARAAFDAAEKKQLPALSALKDFPGFPAALATTLEELRLAGEDAKRLEAAGQGFEELAALASRYEAEIEAAHIVDRAALLRLATWAWRRPHHAALRGAPLLLLDVPIASRRARDFVSALLQPASTALATVCAGDDLTKKALLACGAVEDRSSANGKGGALARLRHRLFTDEMLETAGEDESVRLFSAPGEARECVEIARKALDAARKGVPFDEIAVFLRAPEQYTSHLETAFRRAHIPFYFARGTFRPDPAGRAFLALLACKSEGLSAKRFAEYLSFAQVPDPAQDGSPRPAGETWVAPKEDTLAPRGNVAQLSMFDAAAAAEPTAPPSAEPEAPAVDGALRAPWKWEQYLVEAAVIGGRERWARRLKGFEGELTKKRAELTAEEGEERESARVAVLSRELVNLGHLERFALPVIDILAALPARARWGEWLDRLTEFAPRVLRRPDHVLEVLAEMRPMSAVGPVSADEVRGVLHERLSNLEEDPPDLRFGRVFVSTPDGARGRSFRVVFVPGLAERVFPRRPREDPLLTDVARRELERRGEGATRSAAGRDAEEGAGLRLQDDRANDERLRLRLAIGAASERVVLSYPRLDVREARPHVLSFYGLDVDRAVRGVLPDPGRLEQAAADEAKAFLAWPAPESPEHAIDAFEYDLSVLLPCSPMEAKRTSGGRRAGCSR